MQDCGLWQTGLYVYVCVSVEVINTCNTGNFGNKPLCLCLCCCIGYVHIQYWSFCQTSLYVYVFVVFNRVCTYVRLGVSETIISVYVCVNVEGMYTCKTGHFVNEPLCLCLCCCRGYL